MTEKQSRQGNVDRRAIRTMAVTELTSEEDLASLLPDDPSTFFKFLVADYGERLAACVGKHGRGVLNEHDIADVLQETFRALFILVSKQDFDAGQPVLPMVFTIARNKAVDARRTKLRGRKIGTNESDVTDLIISDMAGSDLAFDYRYASEEEKQRLDAVLADIVTGLPARQQLAVNAFLDCYEEIREKNKHRLVADAMSRLSGERVDVVAAKSALRVGLEKVRSELVRRGIKFVDRRSA